MKFRTLLLSAAASLVAMACGKEPAPQPAPEKLPIKLSASLYQFTKATDTSFENGDEISVNIFNPECYLYNAHFTYSGGQFTSSVPYEWYEDTDVEATITAMYPASNTMEGFAATQSFMVYADQSTKVGYAASDLLLATAKAYPTAEAVNLPFKHALSKIVVNVDNQLKEEIANVWFTDVLGAVSFSTADHSDLTATGAAGTIKAYNSGENTWQLIVAPQTASPKLALTTVSGKQYTFVLTEEVTFTTGKVSTATVSVSPESIYTAFTPEISDWVADNELNFSQKDDEEVVLPEENEPIVPAARLIYLNPWQWISDSPRFEAYFFEPGETWATMTDPDGDGIYECEIPAEATKVIFIRMDSAKPENNWDSKWNQTEDLTIPADMNCFTITAWDGGAKGESLGTWSVQ